MHHKNDKKCNRLELISPLEPNPLPLCRFSFLPYFFTSSLPPSLFLLLSLPPPCPISLSFSFVALPLPFLPSSFLLHLTPFPIFPPYFFLPFPISLFFTSSLPSFLPSVLYLTVLSVLTQKKLIGSCYIHLPFQQKLYFSL